MAAVREEPPPTVADLMRRLHYYEGSTKRLFPVLVTAVAEARRAWQVKELEKTRDKLEKLAAESQGDSVPNICKAAGVGIAFLMHRFPELYRRIISKYIHQRDTTRLLRRKNLREEVDRIVAELSRKSITPSVGRVIDLLSNQVNRDWKLIRQAINDATRKMAT